jgi:CBS domain-containing protein
MITPVQYVMTKKLFAIPTGTGIQEAIQLMTEKRIRHLPVVDSREEIVGIVSQRDLAAVLDSPNLPVEMVMSSPVHFIDQDTPLRQAIFQMLQGKFSCLLVSDHDDSAIGVITTDDLLWYMTHLLSNETESSPSFVSAETRQTIGEVAHRLSLMGI